jgi:internalin A
MSLKRTSPLALSLMLIVSIFSAHAQGVFIPDQGLDAAIREALQKPTGPLTEQDLLSLTHLSATDRDISTLEGLEAARNLISLDLQSNRLSQLSIPSSK